MENDFVKSTTNKDLRESADKALKKMSAMYPVSSDRKADVAVETRDEAMSSVEERRAADGIIGAVGSAIVSTGSVVNAVGNLALNFISFMSGGDDKNSDLGNKEKDEYKDEYTLKEVSEKLGVSERTLQRRLKDNLLHAEMKKGKYVVSGAELKRFVNERPKYKRKFKKVENEGKSSQEVIDELHKIADRMLKRPEAIKLMARSSEIDEEIIDLKIQKLKLEMEIYKDEPFFLTDIKKRLCKSEAKKVEIQNHVNAIKFLATHSNETFDDVLPK